MNKTKDGIEQIADLVVDALGNEESIAFHRAVRDFAVNHSVRADLGALRVFVVNHSLHADRVKRLPFQPVGAIVSEWRV